jgi:photosystem II stability/assembly factor-like uncharacterized protein
MNKVLATSSLVVALATVMLTVPPLRAEPSPMVISDVPLRSDRTIVLAAEVRGKYVLAGGERGAIFVSEDGGIKWEGFRAQKTTRTLTSVVAFDDKTWIGAGHGGVLLRSEDGGKPGTAKLIETEAGKDSFLGLTILGPSSVIAYGAFGLMIRSDDTGRTWKRQQVIDKDFDRHINRVIASTDMLLLVGESGTLAKSTDAGLTWTKLASPYEGSYFGATMTPSGAALIFGMRGNIFRSADKGASWQKIEVPTKLPFFSATKLRDGAIVLAGGQGWVAISRDDGQSFKLKRVASKSTAGLFERTDGTLVVYGEQGIRPVPAETLKN